MRVSLMSLDIGRTDFERMFKHSFARKRIKVSHVASLAGSLMAMQGWILLVHYKTHILIRRDPAGHKRERERENLPSEEPYIPGRNKFSCMQMILTPSSGTRTVTAEPRMHKLDNFNYTSLSAKES